MRLINEKNLAFNDQPKPLLTSEVTKLVKEVKARKPLNSTRVDLSLLVPTAGDPKTETSLGNKFEQQGYAGRELKLTVGNFKLGQHVFPPGMAAQGVESLGNKSAKFAKALDVQAFVPDHLDLRPVPIDLPRELQVPPFLRAFPSQENREIGFQATTVFPPENRRVFHDTAYPWSTCGRIDTPNGQGSGVMVGPRHLLTVSHVIQWNNDNTTGWLRFRPSFFDGSAPFGEAWGTLTYYKYKVSGPTIDFLESMYDYVVVVLNNNIGNLTGWMGSRGYTDGWDGGAYWSHIGYPGDLTAGNRPTFENGIALDGAWYEFDSHEAMSHRADVWPGQSGGPFFGWWNGDAGPRVVSVQSSQNSGENNASGGQDLVDLIIRARNEHP